MQFLKKKKIFRSKFWSNESPLIYYTELWVTPSLEILAMWKSKVTLFWLVEKYHHTDHVTAGTKINLLKGGRFHFHDTKQVIEHSIKLVIIYSLDTLWYFVRNLSVAWFSFSNISTGLRSCSTNVALKHLRSDALPDTTMIWWESNLSSLVWKTHALPIAPRPLP